MKLSASVFLLCFLSGCTAPVPKTSPGAPSFAPPRVSAAPPSPSASASPRVFDESILRGREFLLETASPQEISIRDVVLGPLGNDPEILRTVERFFREAASGTVEKSLLADRWAAYLAAWAQKTKDQGLVAESVRAGVALEDSQGEWTVPVRVLSKEKEYQGWVVLVREGKILEVSDVQLEALSPSTAPFDPEAQGQEISSPIRR